jgi:hypothetical protein
MLSSSDSMNRALTHNGHVTVLKYHLSGGGGAGDEDQDGLFDELTIDPDGFTLTSVPGSDNYTPLPNGRILHTFSAMLSVSGSIGDVDSSTPFSFGPLMGTITEVGRLSNAVVPEPASLILVSIGGLMASGRRRRRV